MSESGWLGWTGKWTVKHLFREIGLHWGRVYGIGDLGRENSLVLIMDSMGK